ncbi:DapH/DapD/GlmU-related protein [Lentilactobacillus senioris]|uniref:DapH/DapD/GlmU-related protein n=1 Tax=Lentilactobacillus senioris TaxID=931534 RepID=UPI00228037E8|nr:DapH/DapD/GlmU-related protein [Lentilactobacillus senioris]MCY9806717.1 DapH/DapD/GlmU-related protein [Lentilactobacillus senioris]
MVERVVLTEKQQQLITKNKLLIQKLNTEVHSDDEIREILSEITGKIIDSSNEIRLPFFTDNGFNTHLGKHIFINTGVTFTDLGGIYIGDNVLIGPGASLLSVNHPLDPAQRHQLELQVIHVKKNAWIGAGSRILPGVTVGENAVVGAGVVVTKDVPANMVVAGVPAKVIRQIEN